MAPLQGTEGIAEIKAIRSQAGARRPAAPLPGNEDAAAAPAQAEVEISRAARIRQALLRREAPPRVDAAGALPERSVDGPTSRPQAAAERLSTLQGARRAEDRRSAASEQRSAPADPVLAVRVGLPPVDTVGLVGNGRSAGEAVLRERAVLRDVGQVLRLPEVETGDPRESASEARADGETPPGRASPEELVLGGGERPPRETAPLGSRRGESAGPRSLRPGNLAGRDLGEPRATPERREEPPAARDLFLDLQNREALAQPGRLRDVSAVAAGSGSGAVRDPNNQSTQQAPLPGSGSREQEGTRRVREVSSQVGFVAARANDALVTRFLGNTPDRDPGPEPRFREPLTA